MTFVELQDDALRALNYSTTGSATDPRTRIKAGINAWHRRLLSRPGFMRLLRDAERTFDSVTAQPVYGLTYPMGRVNGISERTNDISLVRRDLAWIRRMDPGLDTLGQPEVYAMRGWFPVQRQPSTASSVFAIGTSAGNLDTLHWEYILSDGSRRIGFTGLNGTTAVQLGTATTVVEIVELYLATHAGGTAIEVRQSSGTGTVLVTFQPPDLNVRFLHVQLWPTPQSATTYYVDYTREIADMVNASDEPLIPPDFHHILSLGAQHDEFRRMDDDRAQFVRADLDDAVKNLNSWLWDLADATDERPDAGWGRSRLGPWFPRGS